MHIAAGFGYDTQRLAIELDADQAHVVDVGVNANVIAVLAELGDGRHSEQWR